MNDTTFEVQDFERDVLEASNEIPVLVDFWAPWCGPCRMLGPVLEKLALENEGTWRLVKVNTDVHQDVAATYRIRGIPAVKLFVEGRVVDEFTGALPEYAVRQWLEKALPSENKHRLEQAQMALAEDDLEQAETLLRQILETEPKNDAARVLLARIVVFDDPDEAERLISGTGAFAGPGFVQIEEAVATMIPLLRQAASPESLPDEPGREDYRAGLEALASRDFDGALKHFITVIQTNRYYGDDGARKACVALFNLLGPSHPTTRNYRRVFDRSLY